MAKIMLNSLQEKVSVILHDASHEVTPETHYCVTCGQPLPTANATYGEEGASLPRRIGIGLSILLHVLVLLYFTFRTNKIHITPPSKPKGEIMYISPITPTPKTPVAITQPTPKPQPKPVQAAKSKPAPSRKQQAVATAKQAPVTKQETIVPPVQATMQPPPPQEDMSAAIARKQAARAAARAQDAPPSDSAPAEESDGDRANRIARANIAGAQGATSGQKDDSGGIFDIKNKTYRSADLKFRGWNGNFKRKWSQQITVERGSEPDIETAVIKKMIELIRQEKTGDFEWESHRLGRNVPLSARPSDEAELFSFLMKEIFPEYRK